MESEYSSVQCQSMSKDRRPCLWFTSFEFDEACEDASIQDCACQADPSTKIVVLASDWFCLLDWSVSKGCKWYSTVWYYVLWNSVLPTQKTVLLCLICWVKLAQLEQMKLYLSVSFRKYYHSFLTPGSYYFSFICILCGKIITNQWTRFSLKHLDLVLLSLLR